MDILGPFSFPETAFLWTQLPSSDTSIPQRSLLAKIRATDLLVPSPDLATIEAGLC